MQAQLTWTSERSLRIKPAQPDGPASTDVSSLRNVLLCADAVRSVGLPWLVDTVPSAESLLLIIDPLRIEPPAAEQRVREVIDRTADLTRRAPGQIASSGRHVIPACYDEPFAMDLASVASRTGLREESIAEAHCSAVFTVECMGFAPGFGYLAGLPEDLLTERRPEPRTRVPGGSVAIAGARSCVYPFDSPGGWNIIGRTPIRMFDAGRERPARLAVGDTVRFERIDRATFDRLAADVEGRWS